VALTLSNRFSNFFAAEKGMKFAITPRTCDGEALHDFVANFIYFSAMKADYKWEVFFETQSRYISYSVKLCLSLLQPRG